MNGLSVTGSVLLRLTGEPRNGSTAIGILAANARGWQDAPRRRGRRMLPSTGIVKAAAKAIVDLPSRTLIATEFVAAAQHQRRNQHRGTASAAAYLQRLNYQHPHSGLPYA